MSKVFAVIKTSSHYDLFFFGEPRQNDLSLWLRSHCGIVQADVVDKTGIVRKERRLVLFLRQLRFRLLFDLFQQLTVPLNQRGWGGVCP